MRVVCVASVALLFTTPALASRHPTNSPANGITYFQPAAVPAYPMEPLPRAAYRHYRHHAERQVRQHSEHRRSAVHSPDKARPRRPGGGADAYKEARREPAAPPKAPPSPPEPGTHQDPPLTSAPSLLGAITLPDGDLWADGMSQPHPAIVRSRPYHIVGKIKIAGLTFDYASGGRGRGSIPYGDYPVTTDPNELGRWGRRHGALGLAHNNGIWDPQVGDTREGVEIHAARHLASAGCVVIERFDQAKHAILSMIAEAGGAFLHVWPGVASITPSRTSPDPVIYLAQRADEEHHREYKRMRVTHHHHLPHRKQYAHHHVHHHAKA